MAKDINHDVIEFYRKLLYCEANSGKMRWNAISEDLISIYENLFEEKHRLIDSGELWKILFEPSQKQEVNKKKLNTIFENKIYRDFFMKTLYTGLDDPRDWTEWVTQYRY